MCVNSSAHLLVMLDVPEKNALVRGIYALPADASRIRARITDLFAECTEFEIRV